MRGEAEELRPVAVDPDSRARTHLANERTFLSWLRTAITLVTLGLAAGQFLNRNLVPGLPIVAAMAITLIGCGIFVAVAGVVQYFQARWEINEGRYRSSKLSILISTIIVVIVGLIAVWFVFAGHH